MPTYSQSGLLGSTAPDFTLKGVDGKVYQLSDFSAAKALVVAFMCNHCPYVVAVQPRMIQLAREYASRGVSWVGINSNDAQKYPDDSFEAMKVRALEQNFPFPYLFDETQAVAKAFQAACTPEFYLYSKISSKWILKYQGRLDDNWKDESQVTQQELRNALDQVLLGSDPVPDQKPAMGCSIKWKAPLHI